MFSRKGILRMLMVLVALSFSATFVSSVHAQPMSSGQVASAAKSDQSAKAISTNSVETSAASASHDSADLADVASTPRPSGYAMQVAQTEQSQTSASVSTARQRGPPSLTADQERSVTATASDANGQCGGAAYSKATLLDHWSSESVTAGVFAYYGLSGADESVSGKVNEDFGLATLAKSMALQDNQGCSSGALFGALLRTLSPGTQVWIDETGLRVKYPDGFSLKSHKGWKKVVECVTFRAQATCSNPGRGTACVFVWVKKPPKKTVTLTIQKVVQGGSFQSGIFRFQAKPRGHAARTVTLKQSTQTIRYSKNTTVSVKELKPLAGNYKLLTPQKTIKLTHSRVITFVNQVVETTPPPCNCDKTPCNCQPQATPTPTPVMTPTVLPTPPPGTCNVVVVITGNGNNTDIHSCTVTIIIYCSGVNVQFGGPDSKSVNDAVDQYEHNHSCNTTTPTPTPCGCGTPTPTPTPTSTPTPTPTPTVTPTPTPTVTPTPTPTSTPTPTPTSTPTPTPTATPEVPKMQVKNVTSPEEVDNNGETYPNLYADAYTPNGDSITCVVGVTDPDDHSQSGFGSIVGARSFTFVSHGYDRPGPFTYKAPQDALAVGQYDQIEVTCHNNTDRRVADAQGFSKPFQIHEAPGTCCSAQKANGLALLART